MQNLALQKLNKAKEYEGRSSFWEAAQKYQEALLEFNKLSSFESEKGLCKKKIREMNAKKSEDFKEVSAEHEFTDEQKKQLNDFINSFVAIENTKELLDKIGGDRAFCPNYARVQTSSQENMPVSFLIANLTTQDAEGNLIRGGHDPNAVSFTQNYGIEQGLIIRLYLLPIFHRIMDEKLNIQNLSDYFRSKEIFTEDFLKILDVAIERFFAADYVSTLHILVPKFEKVFLDLTGALEGSADTIAARTQKGAKEQVWTQDRTLSEDFLKNETTRKIWGEDFCEQITFVFFSPLGYKLRHKIAHGYSKINELNFQSSVLVLYFFLVLAARVKKVKKQL